MGPTPTHDPTLRFGHPTAFVGVEINVHGGSPLTGPDRVAVIRAARPPGLHLGPLLVFFTELSMPVVAAFAQEQGLSRVALRRYDQQYIRPCQLEHPELDAWLHDDNA